MVYKNNTQRKMKVFSLCVRPAWIQNVSLVNWKLWQCLSGEPCAYIYVDMQKETDSDRVYRNLMWFAIYGIFFSEGIAPSPACSHNNTTNPAYMKLRKSFAQPQPPGTWYVNPEEIRRRNSTMTAAGIDQMAGAGQQQVAEKTNQRAGWRDGRVLTERESEIHVK